MLVTLMKLATFALLGSGIHAHELRGAAPKTTIGDVVSFDEASGFLAVEEDESKQQCRGCGKRKCVVENTIEVCCSDGGACFGEMTDMNKQGARKAAPGMAREFCGKNKGWRWSWKGSWSCSAEEVAQSFDEE
ncbi:hypothetical protein ACHAWF_000258 [Thalassiosira exigua]